MWGAAEDLLGSDPKTMESIARTVRFGGDILFDDCYGKEQADNEDLRFGHGYCTWDEWHRLFAATGLTPLAYAQGGEAADHSVSVEDLGNARRRAQELAQRHPEKTALLADDTKSQRDEYEDQQRGAVGVVWLLRKREEEATR